MTLAGKKQLREADERRVMLAEEEKAMQDAIRLSQLENSDRELQQLRASLPPEPPANAEDVCVLAVRLPSGERIHVSLCLPLVFCCLFIF